MLLQLFAGSRHAVLRGVIAAAVERPLVLAEPPPDDARAKLADRTAQGDVRFALAKIAKVLAVVELDHDLRVALMKFAEHRSEQRHENLLARDPDRAARVALLGCRRFAECG